MLGGGAEPATGAAAEAAPGGDAVDAFAAVRDPQALAGRAVLLGYELFLHREYAAMRKLVALVGGESPSEAGLQFILGLSIACGIKSVRRAGSDEAAGGAGASQDQQAAALLGSAVGHLFRAAAGFCGEEAAPLRQVLQLLRRQQQREGGQPGSRAAALPAAAGAAAHVEDADGVDSDAMDALEEQEAEANGHADDAPEQHQREAKLRLDFCEAVMLLFERERVTEGALAFARAALGAVEAAYPPEQQRERLQQQGEQERGSTATTCVFICVAILSRDPWHGLVCFVYMYCCRCTCTCSQAAISRSLPHLAASSPCLFPAFCLAFLPSPRRPVDACVQLCL